MVSEKRFRNLTNTSLEGDFLREVLKQVKISDLQLGDLIHVCWFDASTGSSRAGAIDIPVDSWGLFIGVLGEKNKHIILAQNNFKYSDGLYDVDYTAIPLSWTVKIKVVNKTEVTQLEARALLDSFLAGRKCSLKKRVKNHEKFH